MRKCSSGGCNREATGIRKLCEGCQKNKERWNNKTWLERTFNNSKKTYIKTGYWRIAG